MNLTDKQLQDFWSRVNKDGPVPTHRPDLGKCWTWTGGKTGDYGRTGKGSAHRVSWMIANGRMPRCDLDTCHSCDNTICVNPSHLSECTRSENLRQAARQGRIRSWRQTLTPQQVLEIRSSKEKQRDIAKRYGIHEATVSKIKHKVIWGYI